MKKVILSLLLFFTLLLAAGIFLPYLFKGQIIAAIKKEANSSMNARLDFNNSIKINIFKSFPNLNIGIKDLTLIPTDSAFRNDTLFYTKEFEVAIDIMEYYRNRNFILRSVGLKEADLSLYVNEENKSNWDIFKSDSSESSAISLQFDKIDLENCAFSYHDELLDLNFKSSGINLASSGRYISDSIYLSNKSEISFLHLDYAGIPYLDGQVLAQSGEAIIDLQNFHFSFPKNDLQLNGLPITTDISIKINDEDIDYDISAVSAEDKVSSFFSLIPAVYKTDYSNMVTEGIGQLDFSFKGKYSETSFPAYMLKLVLDKGKLKYPSINHSLSDIFMDLELSNKDGILDHTVLNLSKFHFKLDNDPFDGFLNLRNIFSSPKIKAQVLGHIDLEKVSNFIPNLEGTILNGKINAQVNVDGTVNAKNSLEQLQADGELEVFQLRYKDKSMEDLLYIADAKFIFNNNVIDIPLLRAQLGKDDVSLSGTVSNYLAYLMRDEKLEGSINWYSKNLNLNSYLPTENPNDSSSSEALTIPDNLGLSFNAIVDDLTYGKHRIKNLQSSVLLDNASLNLDKLAGNILGGNLDLSGKYSQDDKNPFAQLNISFADLTTSELINNWPWLKSFAPILEQVEANMLAKLSFSSPLNNKMNPILNELNLGGTVSIENLMLDQLDILQKIDSKLGFKQFAVKDLKDLLLNFRIKDGNLRVEPFKFVLDSSSLELSGISKLDGSLAYVGKLLIPSSYFNTQQTALNNLLKKSNYTDYQYSAKDYYEIAVSIKGTYYKPEVTLNLKEIKQNASQSIKQAINNEKEKAIKKINEKAQSELNELRDTIKESAELAKQKMLAEIDRQKKEAEERLKQEAEEKKKKLKEEAEKKLKGLLK